MTKETFDRKERLKSEKIISNLFKKGGLSFPSYPLRLVYAPIETPETDSEVLFQFALNVPKRTFKRATARNLLRRRIREAFRLNKHQLYDFMAAHPEYVQRHYAFMVLYVAKDTLPYADIDKGMKKMIHKFCKSLSDTP